MYPDALRAGRNASCAGGRVHETPLAKQTDPGHPKGQPMRKRRAQGQQAAASGAFSWVVFYAFRSLFRRGLDNLSRLPADRARKALKWLDFYRSKCVDRRHFSTGPYPATTTRLRFESIGGNAFSISSRYVTSFPACVLRTFATALRALYGIVRQICRTLINQTGADR